MKAVSSQKSIVLISSGQPSTNPRLVKEADTLAAAGYDVTVIYQYWNQWATDYDAQLLPAKKWKSIRVGGAPTENKFAYWASRVKHKLANITAKKLGFKAGIAEIAIGRCTGLLYKEAIKHSTDLYIAHNLAALPAAVKAAKKKGAKCGFDAEDFHRNEVSDDAAEFDVRIKTYIENKYIPLTDYITASSKQIAGSYQSLFPTKNITTILNAFPVAKRVAQTHTIPPLKLFWASQSVGLNRGIADVIRAMKLLDGDAVETHILGFLTADVQLQFDGLVNSLNFKQSPAIFFYDPVAPDELIPFAAQFDVGLAIEPGFSVNNNNALSNKIFTYLNAGLAVILSDTAAQKDFYTNYPTIGKIYERGDYTQLAEIIKSYLTDPDSLTETKTAAFHASETVLNWEVEGKKFLSVIERVLEN